MALYVMADLHLSFGTDKPMDVFGGIWRDYHEKIRQSLEKLSADDVLMIPGDVSWAMNFDELYEDFKFLDSFPCKKIIIKGNHDLWWNTLNKMNGFLKEHNFRTIHFLQNNAYTYEDIALCGTRGWFYEENFKDGHDEKIFKRELIRLEMSLSEGLKTNPSEIYCFFHYPPVFKNFECIEIIELLKKYNVTQCIYGHLHGDSMFFAKKGRHFGIEFSLASADYLNFVPNLLKK